MLENLGHGGQGQLALWQALGRTPWANRGAELQSVPSASNSTSIKVPM